MPIFQCFVERFVTLVKTLQFESKNWYFKGKNRNNKSRRKAFQHLRKCNQFIIYLLHNKENILPHHDELGTKVSDVPAALVDFKHKNFFVEYFNWNDDDLLRKLRSVAFVGQLFSIGYVIVVGFVNNDLDLD